MLTFDQVIEGKTYKVINTRANQFSYGEEVTVVEKGHFYPMGILVKSNDPNSQVKSMAGRGYQLVSAEKLAEIE